MNSFALSLSLASSCALSFFLSFILSNARMIVLFRMSGEKISSLVGQIEQLYFEHIHHILLLHFDISISADRPTSDDSTRCVCTLRMLFVVNVVSTQTVLSVIFSFRHFLFYSLRDSRQFTANKNR